MDTQITQTAARIDRDFGEAHLKLGQGWTDALIDAIKITDPNSWGPVEHSGGKYRSVKIPFQTEKGSFEASLCRNTVYSQKNPDLGEVRRFCRHDAEVYFPQVNAKQLFDIAWPRIEQEQQRVTGEISNLMADEKIFLEMVTSAKDLEASALTVYDNPRLSHYVFTGTIQGLKYTASLDWTFVRNDCADREASYPLDTLPKAGSLTIPLVEAYTATRLEGHPEGKQTIWPNGHWYKITSAEHKTLGDLPEGAVMLPPIYTVDEVAECSNSTFYVPGSIAVPHYQLLVTSPEGRVPLELQFNGGKVKTVLDELMRSLEKAA